LPPVRYASTVSRLPEAQRAIRVTVLDDVAEMRELFSDVLSASGYEVATDSSATADLHRLLASRPDLIVVQLALDPHRDQLTGLQTIHAARSTPELRDVPIIVCSADITGLARAWPYFMDRGGIQQLQLPFGLREFEQVVAEALGRRTSASDFNGTSIARDSEMELGKRSS